MRDGSGRARRGSGPTRAAAAGEGRRHLARVAHLPFGAGARKSGGAQFSLTHAVLVPAAITARCDLRSLCAGRYARRR